MRGRMLWLLDLHVRSKRPQESLFGDLIATGRSVPVSFNPAGQFDCVFMSQNTLLYPINRAQLQRAMNGSRVCYICGKGTRNVLGKRCDNDT